MPEQKKPPKKAGKAQAKKATREKDAQTFKAAAALLNLTPAKDCTLFGCTRQTFTNWMNGVTSAPREAYIILLDRVLEAATKDEWNTEAAIAARIEKRIEKKIAERMERITDTLNKSAAALADKAKREGALK